MIKIDIIDIVNLARSHDFKGGGECIEIAKGKYQLVDTWAGFKRKVGRMFYKRK